MRASLSGKLPISGIGGKDMQSKRPSRLMRAEIRAGYGMIAPLFIGLLVFYIYAFGQSLYDSFTNKSSFGVPKFVGLTNYVNLFKAPYFYQSLLNTLLYVLLCVPLVVAISVSGLFPEFVAPVRLLF
jgi:multiple sugar transport system permease protein